jgi:hypothetical protein
MAEEAWLRILTGIVILANGAYLAWVALPLLPVALGQNPLGIYPAWELARIFLGFTLVANAILAGGAILSFWKGARWGVAFLIFGGLGAAIIAAKQTDVIAVSLGWLMVGADSIVVMVVFVIPWAARRQVESP